MFHHSHYTVAAVGGAGVAMRAVGDTVTHGLASAVQDPATIALAVGVIVAFVVVRERGMKNEEEIKILRSEHRDVMARIERGLTEVRAEIREVLDHHESTCRNMMTGPFLRIGELETETQLLYQRIESLERMTQGGD